MPLYNEETITETTSKTRYEYAHKVEIFNTLNQIPLVKFYTSTVERDNQTDQERVLEERRTLRQSYDSNEVIPLLNPQTGDVIGQIDYDTLFAGIYSLFFQVATKADTPE